MSYRIAVASSNGIDVDEHFGSADRFLIYAVSDDGIISAEPELRYVNNKKDSSKTEGKSHDCGHCGMKKSIVGEVFESGGCNKGDVSLDHRVEIIADCRCIICKKIGNKAERQLERKAITAFPVEISIDEAIEKITGYYNKTDKHLSLRK